MEVMPGYKQTEVGVIPNEWEVKPFRDIGRLAKGKGLLKGDIKSSGSIPAIPYTALYTDFSELLNYSHIKWFVDDETHTYIVSEPCLLIASSSNMEANTGKASAITGAARVAIGREVIVFYTSSDCKYISYLLSTPTYRRKTLALARGTTIKHVYPATFINYQIAFPSLPEQRAISAALSDVDALLNGLDRLIAKKRDIKQAAMQQLLTGRTRLPGFHDEWEAGSLASVIGALDAGVSVNSVEKDDGDIFDGMFILKTSAVVGGRFIPRECKRIALRDLSRACLNPLKGTIIISRMNTPDLVGECGYVDRDYPNLFVPDRLWMTRFKQNLHVSGLWLSYLVSSATLKRQIRAAATGTSGSMKNLSKQAFLQTPILLPSGVEQSAIASVLSDMDAELSALKVRRDKTRLLKQGMMQELLTGKTRLVRTVATHA